MDKEEHIVILSVENKPGVLNKITSLCRRRQYNINSLTVSTTNVPDISHITMVVAENISRVQQVLNQINKIIEVVSAELVESSDVVERESVLLISKNKKVADKLMNLTLHDVHVRIINTVDDLPVLEIVGKGNEIEHVIGQLDFKKDVHRLVRSGLVAIKL